MNPSFPLNFRRHPSFSELEKLINAISNHRAMRLETPTILENMVNASVFFAGCFARNLFAAEAHARLKQVSNGLTPDNALVLLNKLANEELFDLTFKTGSVLPVPHYFAIKYAAKEAGLNVTKARKYFEQKVPLGSLRLHPALKKYLKFSAYCTGSFVTSFSTIALRELTLAFNFTLILKHLPKAKKWDFVRVFFERHCQLDFDERAVGQSHSDLMIFALSGMKNMGEILAIMIKFYELRLAVYDACVESPSITFE